MKLGAVSIILFMLSAGGDFLSLLELKENVRNAEGMEIVAELCGLLGGLSESVVSVLLSTGAWV